MILVELQYFPSINYFKSINKNDILINLDSLYTRKSYRNRTIINGNNGSFNLIVPTIKNKISKKYVDIKIDHSQNWINQHLQSMQSSYGKTPYFLFYKDLITQVLKLRHIFLFDLNYDLLTLFFKLLNFENNFRKEKKLVLNGLKFDDLTHLSHINNDNEINLTSNKIYYNNYFGKNFDTNVSILDLLFMKGPETKYFLNSI
jgi:hypothetical protein